MSKCQRLRVLVKERLSVAAEEIFLLFEGTIVGYEEELCRAKEENKRKQKLLDSVLSPRVVLPKVSVQTTATCSGIGLQSGITEAPQIKEEPEEQSIQQEEGKQHIVTIKQEEEQCAVPVPEFCGVNVKTEEPSMLLQAETPEEDNVPDVHLETGENTEHSSDNESMEHVSDNEHTEHSSDEEYSVEEQTEDSSDIEEDEVRRPPLAYSPTQKKIKTSGDHKLNNQAPQRVQLSNGSKAAQTSGLSSKCKSAPGTSSTVKTGGMLETAKEAKLKKHQCTTCKKKFSYKYQLQVHLRVHSGERPYSCLICNKSLSCQTSLDVHTRQHTTKQAYSCPVCNKVLSSKTSVLVHTRQHADEKSFTCRVCHKIFSQMSILQMHMQTHDSEN